MKVMFLNAVNYLDIGIPQGISLLAAILQKKGHQVKVVDTAFMKTETYVRPNAGVTIYKSTKYDLHDLVADDPIVNIVDETQKQIDEYQPDLFAVAAMTTNYQYSIDLVRKLHFSCKVIFGGVHPTLCPDEVLSNSCVDMLCVGEGDEALPELCDALETKKEFLHINNIWVKGKNGVIIKNGLRPFVDLDTLPCPDWTLFDNRHLFRPFDGKIYSGGFFVTSRGCPGQCTYCVNEVLQHICQACGKYFRRMSPKKIAEQIKYLMDEYGTTWFKFGDDTFLLHTIAEFEELRDLIKPLKIQFGCSIRPDTVTQRKVELLKDMGCVAMSVGIETGNEKLRKEQLNRQISNQQIEDALKIITDAGIRVSTFNLLGIPTESREDVYETIKMNKRLGVKAANVYILYPFPGSVLSRKYNVNILDQEGKIIPMNQAERFNFSRMTREELIGLQKTFNLYMDLPESLWPVIRLAERETDDGNLIFDTLKNFVISNL